jgi:hypothetical protein
MEIVAARGAKPFAENGMGAADMMSNVGILLQVASA